MTARTGMARVQAVRHAHGCARANSLTSGTTPASSRETTLPAPLLPPPNKLPRPNCMEIAGALLAPARLPVRSCSREHGETAAPAWRAPRRIAADGLNASAGAQVAARAAACARHVRVQADTINASACGAYRVPGGTCCHVSQPGEHPPSATGAGPWQGASGSAGNAPRTVHRAPRTAHGSRQRAAWIPRQRRPGPGALRRRSRPSRGGGKRGLSPTAKCCRSTHRRQARAPAPARHAQLGQVGSRIVRGGRAPRSGARGAASRVRRSATLGSSDDPRRNLGFLFFGTLHELAGRRERSGEPHTPRMPSTEKVRTVRTRARRRVVPRGGGGQLSAAQAMRRACRRGVVPGRSRPRPRPYVGGRTRADAASRACGRRADDRPPRGGRHGRRSTSTTRRPRTCTCVPCSSATRRASSSLACRWATSCSTTARTAPPPRRCSC